MTKITRLDYNSVITDTIDSSGRNKLVDQWMGTLDKNLVYNLGNDPHFVQKVAHFVNNPSISSHDIRILFQKLDRIDDPTTRFDDGINSLDSTFRSKSARDKMIRDLSHWIDQKLSSSTSDTSHPQPTEQNSDGPIIISSSGNEFTIDNLTEHNLELVARSLEKYDYNPQIEALLDVLQNNDALPISAAKRILDLIDHNKDGKINGLDQPRDASGKAHPDYTKHFGSEEVLDQYLDRIDSRIDHIEEVIAAAPTYDLGNGKQTYSDQLVEIIGFISILDNPEHGVNMAVQHLTQNNGQKIDDQTLLAVYNNILNGSYSTVQQTRQNSTQNRGPMSAYETMVTEVNAAIAEASSRHKTGQTPIGMDNSLKLSIPTGISQHSLISSEGNSPLATGMKHLETVLSGHNAAKSLVGSTYSPMTLPATMGAPTGPMAHSHMYGYGHGRYYY
ncbi:MAG: hypothetical protein AAF621_05155 [Pseudomonadota bacterium]